MKERLNLTIDGALLEAMKVYAAGKGISVSELVESYFRQVTRPVLRQNILDMVDQLEGSEDAGGGIVSGGKAPVTDGKEVKNGL
ncbi:MAG TPA: DUF6364 family protein [Puia sp.]|jgi:hypothetical protein